MAPCIPALQGGCASPGPPTYPARRSCRRQLPFGAGAPPGDLPTGTPIRMKLPLPSLHLGASIHTLVATHVPPSKPGVTRFYAHHVFFDQRTEAPIHHPLRHASAAGNHRQGAFHCSKTRVAPRASPQKNARSSLVTSRQQKMPGKIRIGSALHVPQERRKPCAHHIPPGRSPEGALRRREAARHRNAVQDEWE